MDRDALIALDDAALLATCEVDRYRASGPGGQHRNKTESAIRLRHPIGVTAIGEDTRSQAENKAHALRRLRAAIAFEIRKVIVVEDYVVSPRLAAMVAGGTGPLGEKTRQKPEYLLAMAELLDVFAASLAEVSSTAVRIGATTGATSKLLLHDDRVTRVVARMRTEYGLRPLR
jgi:hypothetical protein